MKLKMFMDENGLSHRDVAKRVGCSPETARRYRDDLRIPAREHMRAIYRITGGAVDANAFYGLSPDILTDEPDRVE